MSIRCSRKQSFRLSLPLVLYLPVAPVQTKCRNLKLISFGILPLSILPIRWLMSLKAATMKLSCEKNRVSKSLNFVRKTYARNEFE